MLLSGDIVSKRGEIEPQITPPPVEITIGIAVPLVEVGTSGVISYSTIKNAVLNLGLPYEVYMSNTNEEIGFVYYLISSELNIDEFSLDQVLPKEVYIDESNSVKPIARYVYDYLVSRGVNFVLAVCLYNGEWTSHNVYTILQVPFEVNVYASDPSEKEFLKRDIDFVLAVYPTPKNTSDAYDLYGGLIYTIIKHVDICSTKEVATLDENSSQLRIGQLERFFILGLPPEDGSGLFKLVIQNAYNIAKGYENAIKRIVLLTSNFTEIYLPGIFGGEAEGFLSGGSDEYDFTWSLAGLPFIMTYIKGGNLAKPLTGKPIGGITFGGTKVGMLTLSDLYTKYGVCLLIADKPGETPTCYRSNTMAYGAGDSGIGTYGVEDTEFSLMFVEDTMDKINREFLRAFRGNILNKTMVKVIEERFKRFVLDDYLSKGWILAYRNVKFKQDDVDPTKIVGSYAYMPAYPINKIWVEHFFIL
jgi:hypothetical protein